MPPWDPPPPALVVALPRTVSQALKEYTPDEAKVVRGGRTARINAVELVPGDVVDIAGATAARARPRACRPPC